MCIRDRHDHDASGMLPCRPSDAHAAQNDPVDLRVSLSGPPLFKIFLYIAESRLIRQSADGARPEGMTLPEYHFRIGLSLIHIYTGRWTATVFMA